MKYVLKLYVTGESGLSARAIANLQRITKESLKGQCVMEIIDILKSPKLAVDNRIVVTPTLIRSRPLPLRRVIGDLSDTENVLDGLGLGSITYKSNNRINEVNHGQS